MPLVRAILKPRKRTLEKTFRGKVVRFLKKQEAVTDVIPLTSQGKGTPDLLVETKGPGFFYLELKGGTGHDESIQQENVRFQKMKLGVQSLLLWHDEDWKTILEDILDFSQDDA